MSPRPCASVTCLSPLYLLPSGYSAPTTEPTRCLSEACSVTAEEDSWLTGTHAGTGRVTTPHHVLDRSTIRRTTRSETLRSNDLAALREAFADTLDTFQTLQTIENLIFADRSYPPTPHPTPDNSFDIESSSATPSFSTPQPSPPSTPTHPPVSVLPPLPVTPPTSTVNIPPTPAMAKDFHMPMAHSRDAPKFVDDASGFDAFFEDVEELAARAGLNTADTIKWAIRYASPWSDAWKHVPCLSPDALNAPTLAEFKAEVLQYYPDLNNDRRYTSRDLERLLERTQDYQDMSRSDLGEYYRRFITYSTYLVNKGRLSERERGAWYLKGFPQPVRVSILQRLTIKKPDVLPEDGYSLTDIHSAAEFVLNTGVRGRQDATSATTLKPKVELADQGGIGELIQAVSQLTRIFTTSVQGQPSQSSVRPQRSASPAPGGASLNSPRWTQRSSQDIQGCMFCSSPDHFVKDCPTANQYLRQGKIIRNDDGKLSLPDGRYPSRTIQGRNMRERVDNHWIAEGIYDEKDYQQETFSTHFLEGPEECIFTLDLDPIEEEDSSASRDSSMGEARHLQAQMDALREAHVLALEKAKKKVRFDGVEILKRTGPPKPGAPIPRPLTSATLPTVPSVYARVPPRTQATTSQDPPAATNAAGKPGTRAGDNSQPRPQGPMRPMSLQPKSSSDDPKFRYQSSIESTVKPGDVADRALDAKIMITARELLAMSPDVRRHVKDLVTSKKVSANAVEVDEVDAFLTDCFEEDTSAVLLDLVKYDSSFTAAPSLPLRVIFPTFAPGVQPECILDGGAQVVVMRKDVWERLRVPLVANRAMPMESANATTTMTLGLIEDHPVQLGPVTIYLQIQVVEHAPFEVLLGRPFFDITSCSEVSSPGGNHEIRIKDPKSGTPYVFSTEPRVRKTQRSSSETTTSKAAVNFRL